MRHWSVVEVIELTSKMKEFLANEGLLLNSCFAKSQIQFVKESVINRHITMSTGYLIWRRQASPLFATTRILFR